MGVHISAPLCGCSEHAPGELCGTGYGLYAEMQRTYTAWNQLHGYFGNPQNKARAIAEKYSAYEQAAKAYYAHINHEY